MNNEKPIIKMSENGQLSFSDITKTLSDLPSFKVPEWEIIDNEDALGPLAKKLQGHNVIGLDIETTGLDPHVDKVRLVQIATSKDYAYIINMNKVKSLDKLKVIFNAKKPVKIIHNAIFELKFLKYNYGLNFGSIYDTMVANRLIYNGLYKRSSLGEVVKEELKLFLDKDLQISSWGSKELTDMQLDYAAKDAAVLIPLRKAQIEKIVQYDLVRVAKLEFECTKAVAAMEYNGVAIDESLLEKYIIETQDKLKVLSESLKDFFGDININSHKQISSALAKKGIYPESTSEKILKLYINEYPQIKDFLEYKSLHKILSSTLQSLADNIHPLTGRVHSSYNQLGATSGRMSSHKPNLQNIPRGNLRKIFVSPNNKSLIIADYSQIELRIIADITKDETLINAFGSQQDIHNITASIITHKDINEISKDDRQKAKAVNFGLVYGMGAKGLVRYASGSFNIEMSTIEAEEIHFKFFDTYQGVKEWHDSIKASSNKIEYIETLSGRKRFYNSDKRYYSELFNTPIQGTGADILKFALVLLQNEFDGTSTKLVNTVHDEIIVECNSEDASKVAGTVNRLMVEAGREFIKLVPIAVDIKVADTWAES